MEYRTEVIYRVFDKDLDLGDNTADWDRREVEWQNSDIKSAAAENGV